MYKPLLWVLNNVIIEVSHLSLRIKYDELVCGAFMKVLRACANFYEILKNLIKNVCCYISIRLWKSQQSSTTWSTLTSSSSTLSVPSITRAITSSTAPISLIPERRRYRRASSQRFHHRRQPTSAYPRGAITSSPTSGKSWWLSEKSPFICKLLVLLGLWWFEWFDMWWSIAYSIVINFSSLDWKTLHRPSSIFTLIGRSCKTISIFTRWKVKPMTSSTTIFSSK